MTRIWCGLVLAAGLGAQATTFPHVVLTELPSVSPRMRLCSVDPTSGAVALLPRFASDLYEPLAVVQDPYDGALLVAYEQPGPAVASLVVRLVDVGGSLVEAPTCGPLAGRVVELAVAGDDLLVAVDHANGGLYRVPRRGGAPVLVLPQANLTAMHVPGPQAGVVMLAWTGRPGTTQPDSGTGLYDLATGAFLFGPDTFANPGGRVTTGVVDLPTAVPRQLLAFDDGSFALFAGILGQPPQPVVPVPPVPAGGAVAMHAAGPFAVSPVVLGGTGFPNLYEIDAFSGAVNVLSAALPGAPRDFAWGIERAAHSLAFGAACGPLPLSHGTSGLPQLGTTLVSLVAAPPGSLVLLAGGLDDYWWGFLPAALPGGCDLEVRPEALFAFVTGANGTATQGIPIPAAASFVGTRLFLQWVGHDPAGLSTSAAFAHWVGP